MTWDNVRITIASFRTLEPDYDGEGGNPPSAAIIDSAALIAGRLERLGMKAPDATVPTVNATIEFEWMTDGLFATILEIEDAEKPASLYVVPLATEVTR
jgi:hypothetical protein